MPNKNEIFYSLLVEFTDIFSQEPGDLGKTNIITHSIHTGNAAPVRLPPGRLPLVQRDVAQKAIHDMSEQKLLSPRKAPGPRQLYS